LRAGMTSAHDEILPDWLQKGVLRRTIPRGVRVAGDRDSH